MIAMPPALLEATAEDLDGQYVRDQDGVWRYRESLIAVPGAKDWYDTDGQSRIDAPELDLDPRVRSVAEAEAAYRHVRSLAFEEAEAVRRARNDAVRAALDDGVTYARVAQLTGLSRGRIGLLRDPRSASEPGGRGSDGGWVRSAAFYQRRLRRRPNIPAPELAAMTPRERAVTTAQAELERSVARYSVIVAPAFEQRAEAFREARAAGLSARNIAEICDLSVKRVNEILSGVDYGRARR